MKKIGTPAVGIYESTQGKLDIKANSSTVAEADANGIKSNVLIRNKNEVPNGETWTVASSENAVLVGPITVTGSLVCNGVLAII
ncbi:hypothetical protein [uncultured Mediterranean phage uvMED]|nr:hypothetical protein [uncultured Mediterranean phage uvMED]